MLRKKKLQIQEHRSQKGPKSQGEEEMLAGGTLIWPG